MPARRARSACVDPGRRRLEIRLGLGHVSRHHVLDFEEIDDGLRLLAALLLDPRQVSNPKSFELPHELQAHVVTAGPLVELVVGAEAEDPSLNHLVGSLEAVDQDGGEEHASPLPADPRHSRLNERLVGGELGAVGQGDHMQVGERSGGVDQGDLEVIVLERDDHRAAGSAGGPG